jgi:lipopolysaccharide/colanic/teichoic acid biosynthesis glycosyltransferase
MQSASQLLEGKNFKAIGHVPIKEEPLPSSFYSKYGKRFLDMASSLMGLFFLLPLFGVVAVCVKYSSRGPVFFRQIRVGMHGRLFQIMKFRSMDAGTSKLPAGITVSCDPRITAVGRILRRYKIDELPQLWNVLRGDMSLVGPRPELPKYVDLYSPEQIRVLSVRPGISDPASLAYRYEEEILSGQKDPEHHYCTVILPDKLNRNLTYLANMSLQGDLAIVFKSLFHSFVLVKNNLQ